MRILGLSAFHRDAAAALVVDGQLVAAAQEERFTRLSLDPAFPKRSARYCMDAGGVLPRDLDAVVFYEKPLRKFERLLVMHLRAFPRSMRSFYRNMSVWLGDRMWLKNRIATDFGVDTKCIYFSENLVSLGANALHSSGFEDSAVLVLDDAGEWATTLLAQGKRGTGVEPLQEVLYPNSLGLVASAVTQFLGFVPGEDEGKIEALASFGQPRFLDELRSWVPVIPNAPGASGAASSNGNGKEPVETAPFEVQQGPFEFAYDAKRMAGEEFDQSFGPARYPSMPLRMAEGDSRDADLAASLQALLEERALALVSQLGEMCSSKNLCLSGTLAQNRRLNRVLTEQGTFQQVHVPIAPGKAGGAVGAAMQAHCDLTAAAGSSASTAANSEVNGHFHGIGAGRLGETIDNRAEEGAVELGADCQTKALKHLQLGRNIGWICGPMDFGPQSLGGRCILRSANGEDARQKLLSCVQQTESFLPVRVLIPAERANDYLVIDGSANGHHAWLNVDARESLRQTAPSAILPDGSVWPLLISSEDDHQLHALLLAHGQAEGHPVLLIADLALRGSPLVRNEADAVDAFQRSGLHHLYAAGARLYSNGDEES